MTSWREGESMPNKKYNPEKRAWRGRSYKKGGERIRELRDSEGRRLLMLKTVEIEVSYCIVCGRHITRCPNAPKPEWFHTPSLNNYTSPNDHDAVPGKINKELA